MCYSKIASLISFILGTIFNIFVYIKYKDNPKIKSIIIAWQWVIMMQLSEYFIWTDQNCGKINKFGTNLALIFNLTQPIIVYLVLMIFSNNVNNINKTISSALILIYIIYILLALNNNNKYVCVKPSSHCSHLNLNWWNNFKYGGLVYTFVLLAIIFLMLQPKELSIFVISYISLTLFISIIFYSCGQPSMWCFMVVPFPIFLMLYYEFFLNEIEEFKTSTESLDIF
jgi:hypothetical protein